ncbi:MAG: hypothetical protein HYW88_03575 [Candidatus Sungbacteria bacterium]|nr:hypothetical protein [Candidatus Sungbacteria bacterium]
MKRFLLAFFLAVLGVGLLSGTKAMAQGEGSPFETAPPTNGYYELSDFYYWDKSGNKTLLLVYPKAVVVRVAVTMTCDESGCSEVYPSEMQKVLDDFLKAEQLTAESGVRVEVVESMLGVDEVKFSVQTRKYLIITMQEKTEQYIVSLVNRIVRDGAAIEAHPVFLIGENLVFPAGFWFKVKPSSGKLTESLKEKIGAKGYGWIPARGSSVSDRLFYFVQDYLVAKTSELNPVRMSRLVAEESIAIEWAIPDFVSVRKAITVSPKAFRPSATFGDQMTASFVIVYDTKKVVLDPDAFKSLSAATIRPKKAHEELFKLDTVSVREEPGRVTIDLAFRMYQRGVFRIELPPVFYSFRGATQDIPPLKIDVPAVSITIIGLVPRDANGNSLLSDIFPWKRIPVVPALDPQKPERVIYKKLDLRYWSESLLKTVPNVPDYFRWAGLFLVSLSLLWVAGSSARYVVVTVRHRRSETIHESDSALTREYRLAKSRLLEGVRSGNCSSDIVGAYVAKSNMELRHILGFVQGSTSRDVLKIISPVLKEKFVEVLAILSRVKESGTATENDIAAVQRILSRLRLMRKFEPVLKLVRGVCGKKPAEDDS